MKLKAVIPFILQSTVWWLVMRPFLIFFTGFKVEGIEHIKNLNAPAIFTPNHSHPLDAELVPLALPFWSSFSPMFYVVRDGKKYSSWKKVLFTFINLKLIGAYPLAHDKKDYALSLKTHENLLQSGLSVCIFPEGGLTKDGNIQKAHGGVTHLANATKLPVIPVLITGTYGMHFSALVLGKHRITVKFLPPVYLQDQHHEQIKAGDYHTFAEELLNTLRVEKGERIL